MANKKITDLMSGTPVRDSLLESAIDISGTMDSRKVKAGAVADLASANVAAPYNSATTYAIGQYCLYEGDIYRCIAITTGAFDSTAWVQIVVTGEFRRVVELTSAQYTALSSAEKNNGTLYVITDEETTADDIPYSAGVSVADKLDNVPTFNTLTTSDNNKILGVSVSGSDISVVAFGGITTQTVDGIVWSIRQIGNWYEMWANITIDCSSITPSQWGSLYVYRNALSIYDLPISLTKKVIDFSYSDGNIGMWTVYYTSLGNQEDDRTTADIIRPTTTSATVVIHKYIKGYV